ncbi:hydroxyphenylacetyl-CoA thioesterase PaaI [Amorphus sp. MBR-141]
MDAQETARACADAMWAEDKASQGLGMEIVSVEPGKAVLTMTIREDMVNGHAICHGGFMFLLADSAFAFSCNTYDQRTVAQSCAISFLKPVRLGDRLTATAAERWREGRSGIYDITVTDQTGTTVAEFRGQSRTIAGRLLDGTDAPAAAQ